jgi:hypothetical protein
VDPGFQDREGALKKIAPSGGMREREVHPVTAKESIFDVILKAIRANYFSLFGRVVVSWTHYRFHYLFILNKN